MLASANQSCMALALVRCSIEADQGGTPHARARVSLVSWEGRSHALLFMVPLGLPSARPMAQALRLPFEYYIYNVGKHVLILYTTIIIAPNFRGTQCSWIAVFKKFAETIFADQGSCHSLASIRYSKISRTKDHVTR